MVDFSAILGRKVGEIEKPKPRPIGHYLGAIQGAVEQRTVSTKDGDRGVLRFKVKLFQAREDVDQEELSEHGDLAMWPTYNFDIFADTPEGEYRCKQFCTDALGIDANDDESLGQMLAETPGKQCIWEMKHRPYMDKNTGNNEISSEIGSPAAL